MIRVNSEGEERKVLKTTNELIENAKQKGVCPCDICEQVADPQKCSGTGCFAWVVWFSEHWQNIREAARKKGYRV